MESQSYFKIPPSAIGLDVIGSVLVVLGVISLMEIQLPLVSSLSGGNNVGWTLIAFGVVFMIAGSLLIVASLLATRSERRTPPTIDRRSR